MGRLSYRRASIVLLDTAIAIGEELGSVISQHRTGNDAWTNTNDSACSGGEQLRRTSLLVPPEPEFPLSWTGYVKAMT